MKQDQFCFWLQGYFEIGSANGTKPHLTLAQAGVLRSHLELVKKCNIEGRKPTPKPLTGFCAWLDGTLELAVKQQEGQECISDIALELIQNKLNDEFEHVIDPQMPGDKEELQAVHDGLRKSSPDLQSSPDLPLLISDLTESVQGLDTKTCANVDTSVERHVIVDVCPPQSEFKTWQVRRPGGPGRMMC